MIDFSSVGRRGARFRFPVEESKIRELARATFSTQEAYLGERAVMPPTYPKLSQFLWEIPGTSAVDMVGFDPADPPLHAEQEFVFTGEPPRAGDVLFGQTVVESVVERPSRTFGHLTEVVIATEYEDAGGNPAVVARSTSVQRAVPGLPPRTPLAHPAPPAQPPGTSRSDVPPIPPAPPVRTVGPLSLTDLVRYQGAGGDMNPYHHDDETARRNGFAGAFAPGLLSAALLADWATSWLGPHRIRRFGVRFRSQVFLGDVLTCTGSVSGARDPLVDLDLQCRRQDGSIATVGWATFDLGTAALTPG